MEKFFFVAYPAANGKPDSYKSVEDEKINAFETMGGGTTTSSADFRLLSASEWRLKWNQAMGAQKCANDVQISLERAFPHCVRVFKARKKAPRNTPRSTKRRLRVTIAVNGTANWCSKGPARVLWDPLIGITKATSLSKRISCFTLSMKKNNKRRTSINRRSLFL